MVTKKSTTASKKPTAKKASTNAKSAPKKAKITGEQIRQRAAQIYSERLNNGKQGDELSDWLQAEKELAGK